MKVSTALSSRGIVPVHNDWRRTTTKLFHRNTDPFNPIPKGRLLPRDTTNLPFGIGLNAIPLSNNLPNVRRFGCPYLKLGRQFVSRSIWFWCGWVIAHATSVTAQPSVSVRPVLCTIDVDGQNLSRLAVTGPFNGMGSPRWSRDGRRICCDAWRVGEQGDFRSSHVLVMQRDGTAQRDFGEGALPTFSPDGEFLTYCRRHGKGIWIAGSDGSDPLQIDESGWSPCWSPSRDEIAYTRGNQLVLYDLATEQKRSLLAPQQAARYQSIRWAFCWSPNGDELCFVGVTQQTMELAVISADGGSAGFRVVRTGEVAAQLTWHPTDKRIAYARVDPTIDKRQIYVFDPEEEVETLLAGQSREVENMSPDWSPDGKSLVFVSFVPSE